MVLDTFDPEEDLFIFKNTFDDEENDQPKRLTIKRKHPNAPKQLFFVHIEVEDMESLPSVDRRKADKQAEIELKRSI